MNTVNINGVILYSESDDIKTEAIERYQMSHYEVWECGISGALVEDNIWTLDIPDEKKEELAKRFKITKDDTVLEIGSYNGFGTVRLSELAKHVFSIEANKKNYDITVLNVETNNIDNVTVINAAMSNRQEETIFYEGKHPQAKSLSKSPVKVCSTYKIKTDIVDNIISQVSYVILEINMGELEALEGMSNLLEKHHPKIMTFGWNDINAAKIKGFLEGFGYDIYIGKGKRIYAL